MLVHKKEIPGIVILHLIPLFGVFFLDWDAYTVVVLYFIETIYIGFFTFIKLLLSDANPTNEELKHQVKSLFGNLMKDENTLDSFKRDTNLYGSFGSKMGLGLFFLVHYNFFIIGQSVFITSVFGGDFGLFSGIFAMINHVFGQPGSPIFYMAVFMFLHVGFREYYGYIWNNDFKRLHPLIIMFQPYSRILIQQFVVIFGGMVAMFLKAAVPFVILLSIFKITTDIWGLSILRKSNKVSA